MSTILQKQKGPAEAATSPSRGSTNPEKDMDMNTHTDTTAAARTARSITRRTVLAGTTLLATAPITAAQAETEQHPDAALILAGERLAAAWSRWDFVAEKYRDQPDNAEGEAEYDAAYNECSDAARTIENTKARTLEGLRVKAQAISWCYCGDEIDFRDGQDTTDMRLANSIVRALLEGAA